MSAVTGPDRTVLGGVDTSVSTPALTKQRENLRQGLVDLEEALARPIPGRLAAWVLEVHRTAEVLADAFAAHVAFTENEDDGFFVDLTATAPRLVNAVEGMREEHRKVSADIATLIESLESGVGPHEAEWAASRRAAAIAVMGSVTQHRQKGADLTYEAFSVDIGEGG